MFPHAAGPDAETLARPAEAARVDTARWTHETFGARPAVACEEDLIARCRASAAGTAPSQACHRLVDPDLPGDRRFVRAGQRVVVMERADAVILLDLRHGRGDRPQRPAALVDGGPDRDPGMLCLGGLILSSAGTSGVVRDAGPRGQADAVLRGCTRALAGPDARVQARHSGCADVPS